MHNLHTPTLPCSGCGYAQCRCDQTIAILRNDLHVATTQVAFLQSRITQLQEANTAEVMRRRAKRTLTDLQAEQRPWVLRNFGERPTWMPLMGAVEELGELAHAHLKAAQGIRGTAAEHAEAAKDAVADVVIYLADYCSSRGWDMNEIVFSVWDQVKQRDWKADPSRGVNATASHRQAASQDGAS